MSSPLPALPYPDLFALLVEVQFGAEGPQTTQFDRALGRLIAKNAPIKVENAAHAKLLCTIIDIFRVVAFWNYTPFQPIPICVV
ncbi:hypothetical protein DFH09DRAFT_1329758 [Mycena vulgaris]|nr:hypothetical protein DFH09DRAFT_1329758 [Mycena vulgaris]